MSKPEEKLLEQETKVEELLTKENTLVTNGDVETLQSTVESERSKLKALFKKSKKISNFSVLIAVALIIICFILVSMNNDALKIVGYCIGGVALVGMLVFYVINKNKFPNSTKEYINVVETLFNSFAFSNDEYKDIFTDRNEKIEKADVAADLIYKDISRLASRNIVHAKFNGQPLTVADLALYHKGPKNVDLPTFVGKYFSMANNIAFDGRIIISLRNLEKETDLPDCIEDLELVKEDNELRIYASKGLDYKEVLGTKLVSELRKNKIEDHLLNINIVIWGGHTAGYLSFDDETMVFPFEKEFSSKPYEQYEKTQFSILNSLKVLNKEKKIVTKEVIEEVVEEEVK